MKDPHMEQWLALQKKYESIGTEEMKFRAECINNLLIDSTAKEMKDISHFK